LIRTANSTTADPADVPIVRIRDVEKTYYVGEVAVPAVRGVSLDIHRGELVAIMGPSGSGKSTLMHILGALDRADRGQYWLDGVEISGLSKRQLASIRNEKLGFVFQSFNLLSRTTVLDNVALPLTYAGVTRRNRRRRATEMLERVGLGDRARHHTNQLSGGQQQRVAIARGLVTKPILLLADEPTGNLDSRTGNEIMALLQQLNEDDGLTIVLVTHEPEISRFARRVISVRDGLIASDQENADYQPAAALAQAR